MQDAGPALSLANSPNQPCRADCKGAHRLHNRKYSYSLTITDFRSRYRLECEARENTRSTSAFPVFERDFRAFGLPDAIRTDNGYPPTTCTPCRRSHIA